MSRSDVLQINSLPLAGALLVKPRPHYDDRGSFAKTFHASSIAQEGLRFELREEFYSVSKYGVLRGMHFQTPPYDHQKLVTCFAGRVLDVLVDLRRGSPTYGRHCSLELNGDEPCTVWIPHGLAHGFLSLADNSCVVYKTDSEYAPTHDMGIRWDSFDFHWPLSIEQLIISARDQQHPTLAEFNSPFCDLAGAKG